jgi:hypothetical protein
MDHIFDRHLIIKIVMDLGNEWQCSTTNVRKNRKAAEIENCILRYAHQTDVPALKNNTDYLQRHRKFNGVSRVNSTI